MMNEHGKSDNSVLPKKPPNNVLQEAAEAVEGRELAKGNLLEQNTHRIQSRANVPSALERVRQAAKGDRRQRLTALMHHVYAPEMLEFCYYSVNRGAAAGIDGETWRHYGERLGKKFRCQILFCDYLICVADFETQAPALKYAPRNRSTSKNRKPPHPE